MTTLYAVSLALSVLLLGYLLVALCEPERFQ
jgi:K+-transporting ATPase KdpF subunit